MGIKEIMNQDIYKIKLLHMDYEEVLFILLSCF